MISRRNGIGLAALLVAIALAPTLLSAVEVTLFADVAFYALLTLSVCAIVSYAGQFALLQPVFATLAGYTLAISLTRGNLASPVAIAIAIVVALAVAAILALFMFRIAGFYLAIATLLVTELVGVVVGTQAAPWTGGYFGLEVSSVRIGPVDLSGLVGGYYVLWAVVGLTALFFANLEGTRVVRSARAVKANQAAAQLAAINPWRVKAGMFLLSSFVAALAGVAGVAQLRYIDPTTFDINLMILVFAAVIIGGRRSFWGALVGAAFLVIINQLLGAFLEAGTIVYGAVMIGILALLPGGLTSLPEKVLARLRRRASRPISATIAIGDGFRALPTERVVEENGSILEVENLSVRFGAYTAVEGVGFSLGAGRIVALLGPNGAGKTTVFNAITGHVRPSSGSIRMVGKELTAMTSYEIRRAGVSRTLQHPYMFTELTVWENIALGCDYMSRSGILKSGLSLPQARRSEKEVYETALTLATNVGLREMAGQRANQLSFGQARLVEIARSLAGPARVLLLDEPFAGLSFAMIETMKAILLDLRGRGYTILLIDHNFEHVSNVSDDGIFMLEGRVSKRGRLSDLLTDESLVRQYAGI